MQGGSSGGVSWGSAAFAVLSSALLAAALSLGATPAFAQERPSMIVDTTTPKLVEAEDGAWKVDVVLTNVTGEELTLSAQPADLEDTGCRLQVPKSLPPAQQSAITVGVPAVCQLSGKNFKFEIDAETADNPIAASVPFTAGPKPDSEETPNWDALSAFPVALGILTLVALMLFVRWKRLGFMGQKPPPGDDGDRDGEPAPKRSHRTPLSYLDQSWSFKESWVSNITVGTALITGIFGSSEVLTAMLGDDAKESLAVVIVASAAAALLVALGPVVLAATKTKSDKFSAGGLFVATVVVLAGALAEVFVVAESATRLDLGGLEDWVPWAAAMVGALLLLYTFRNVDSTLRTGTTPSSRTALI